MDHILGPLLAKGRESIIVNDLSSLLLNILSCWLLGRTQQPIPSRELFPTIKLFSQLTPPFHFFFFFFFIHRVEKGRTALLLSQKAGIAFSGNWCKTMTVKDIWVFVLAGDTRITPRYLCLLHVKRSVLTTHLCLRGDSTVLQPSKWKKSMPMMSNIPIKIHHE